MSVVHYKFKNNLDYKTIKFDGLSISLGDLKRAIMTQNKTKSGEFDLEITNAQNKEVYTDDATQISKNASVVIRRVPVGPKGKALTAAERPESPGILGQKSTEEQAEQTPPVIPLSKLNKIAEVADPSPSEDNNVADLASANASEDDKITAMMNQAGEEWDPSLYAKAKGRYSNVIPRGPVPSTYICYRCRKPGHWIQSCPTNGDPNYDQKVRRTTGIPKSFLRQADNASQKGALFNAETGQYAVPFVDHYAYEQAATKKRAKDATGVIVGSEKAVPMEYICPICKKVMTNAVVVPCCGENFCDECIVSYLVEKEQICPSCGTENVSPDSIVLNKLLRQAIIKLRSTNTEGSLSATSSPSAYRDDDISSDKPAPLNVPVAVTTASVTVTEKAPSPTPAVTTLSESAPVKPTVSSPSTTTQVATSSSLSQTESSAPKDPETSLAVTRESTVTVDSRLPRHQVTEGYPQPLRMPTHGSLAPIHRPSYVVAGSGMVHHHHPMVHPAVTSLGIPAYAHIAHHPAYLPPRPALPFSGLAGDLGGMMTKEEFRRAQLVERGRRKRRSDDDGKKKHRSRHRGRRHSPSSRRSPSEKGFEFELSNFEALQRERLRRRSRSRSWTPSGSSSLSNSSWSHSWSRSKSPSRSYSRSKSRTPVNWDRSRSPSPDAKHEKAGRSDEDRKKRKKPEKGLPKKRSKTNTTKDGTSKAPIGEEGKKVVGSKNQVKEFPAKEITEKVPKKKDSEKATKQLKENAKTSESNKRSKVKINKGKDGDVTIKGKDKEKQATNNEKSGVSKTSKKTGSGNSSPVRKKKTEESVKADFLSKKKNLNRTSKDTKDKTGPKRTIRDNVLEKIDKSKKESTKRDPDSRRSSVDENKDMGSSVKEKSSRQIKKKASGEPTDSRAVSKGVGIEDKKKNRKAARQRVEPSDKKLEEIKTKEKKREGKKKKQRKSLTDSENDEERRVSRKRPKEEEDDGSEAPEKSRRKKKKRKHSVEDGERKETKHKKRKKKKKHRKHKHKKKVKHKEKSKEEKGSEEASSLDSDVGDQREVVGNDGCELGKTKDNEGRLRAGAESSRSEIDYSDSGSEDENALSGRDNEESVEGGSVGDNVDSEENEELEVDVEMMEGGDISVEDESEAEIEEEQDDGEQDEQENEERDEEDEEEELEEEEEEEEKEVEVVQEEDVSDAESSDEDEEEQLDYNEEEEEEEEEIEMKENSDDEMIDEIVNEKDDEVGKMDHIESGSEADILGDLGDEVAGEHDLDDDEALLGDTADMGEPSESEQGIEELLVGEEDSFCQIDHDETASVTKTDMCLVEMENTELSETSECNTETNVNTKLSENNNRNIDVEKKQSNETSEYVETELLGTTSKSDCNIEVGLSNANTETNTETSKRTVERVNVENAEAVMKKLTEAPFVKRSSPEKTFVNKPEKASNERLDVEQKNGVGGRPAVLYTTPVPTKLPHFPSYDSGIATLSSLDSLPELDDPNYTDFGAAPSYTESRRTSTDILRSLLDDSFEDDL